LRSFNGPAAYILAPPKAGAGGFASGTLRMCTPGVQAGAVQARHEGRFERPVVATVEPCLPRVDLDIFAAYDICLRAFSLS
jgi:hypothetical protein